MKYVILVGDGMADWPVKDLSGKTPLEAARIPNIDWICQHGTGGRAQTVPSGMEPGSDVANMSILGYDPRKNYSGRGPFEAASYGVPVARGELAFRCNLVTIVNGTMADYSAGHIKTEESAELTRLLNREIGNEKIKFFPGVSYRNLMIISEELLKGGRGNLKCVPPHDITGKEIRKYLPRGKGAKELCSLTERSVEALSESAINKVKIDLGENPANMIWLWGGGGKVQLPLFTDKYGLSGGMISAVGLLKGIGKCIGMEIIDVPGATGYYDTNYEGKAQGAIAALDKLDFVFIHVEAPDEAGHNGDLRNKILAIENFDQKVVGPVLEYLRSTGSYRIMVLPDHYTPLEIRTHIGDPVPFALCGNGVPVDTMPVFTEKAAEGGSIKKVSGYDLINTMLKDF